MNRIIFVGAVKLSQTVYEELLNFVEPVLLVTLLPRLAHRHSDYRDLRKVRSGIPCLEVDNINDHIETLKSFKPDYILVWGWSQLICKELLEVPTIGCIGLHPSPLPRNRGRAVLPWTILTRQKETGVTLFYIDEGTDSGDIIAQRLFEVDEYETARTLYDKTNIYAKELVQEVGPFLKEGVLKGTPQDHSQANYFAKRIPSDGLIDWTQPATDIERLIRATTDPYPGAYSFYKGNKVIIWESKLTCIPYQGMPGQILLTKESSVVVQCGIGQLELTIIGDSWGKLWAAKYIKNGRFT